MYWNQNLLWSQEPEFGMPERVCQCFECRGIVHRVTKGETLYAISRRYQVALEDIMDANPNINVYNLREGDRVCVPVMRPTQPTQPMQPMQPTTRPMPTTPRMFPQMPQMPMQPEFDDDDNEMMDF